MGSHCLHANSSPSMPDVDAGTAIIPLYGRFQFLNADQARAKEEADPSWKELGAWTLTLAQPRSLRYLGVRIVAPENRMAAMGDDHEQPNIDLEFCGGRGLIVDSAPPISSCTVPCQ